jgi:hypothetical protein
MILDSTLTDGRRLALPLLVSALMCDRHADIYFVGENDYWESGVLC